MTLAIHELEQAMIGDRSRVDRFFAEKSFPVVEGTNVTFVFRGEADQVHLRHWIFGLPFSRPLRRLDGSDIWFIVVDIPESSRVEYKFEVILGEDRRWLRDALNPHLARDPFGANSVCLGSGYERPDWTLHDPESRPGTFEELVVPSQALASHRQVRVYLPARFRKRRRYPLLIAHDGDDYLRFSDFKVVLDNLIHRQEIAPVIVALCNPVDRLREYAANEAHARFIVEELLPELEGRYPVRTMPGDRGLLGASFGAVASLYAAWKYPGVFGRLLLQSGSFAFTDIGDHQRGPAFDTVVNFVNAFRDDPGRPSERLYVSCGVYESLIYENRSMVPLLQSTGMTVRFREVRDGHNWENWRDRLREGLSWLYPGPLWMVYE